MWFYCYLEKRGATGKYLDSKVVFGGSPEIVKRKADKIVKVWEAQEWLGRMRQ